MCRAVPLLSWVVLASGLCACGGGQSPQERTAQNVSSPAAPLLALDNTRWSWTHATCDDGQHQLDALGFDDRLHVTAIGHGVRLTHQLMMEAEGCAETVVTWVSADGAAFRFADQARVADAADRACVDGWPREHTGEIQHQHQHEADTLELRVHRSALCGGYDIRHSYRRVTRAQPNDHALIRQVVVGLALRDADVITEHFAAQSSLVVPKPAREGGGQLRFEGRSAVRGWFIGMVRSVAWIGARILDITETSTGHYTVRVEYMDSELSEPLLAQLVVTLADGEIYEAQWLFASTIAPRIAPGIASGAATDAGTPLPADASLPDTPTP